MKQLSAVIVIAFICGWGGIVEAQNPMGVVREESIERRATESRDPATSAAIQRAAEASADRVYNTGPRSSEDQLFLLALVVGAIWLFFRWAKKRG